MEQHTDLTDQSSNLPALLEIIVSVTGEEPLSVRGFLYSIIVTTQGLLVY